ncbi:hypothetical protein T484DRAFT_1974204, partial [Baffinella frigidus]
QVFPELQSAVDQLYVNREEWRGYTDEALEQHRDMGENNFCPAGQLSRVSSAASSSRSPTGRAPRLHAPSRPSSRSPSSSLSSGSPSDRRCSPEAGASLRAGDARGDGRPARTGKCAGEGEGVEAGPSLGRSSGRRVSSEAGPSYGRPVSSEGRRRTLARPPALDAEATGTGQTLTSRDLPRALKLTRVRASEGTRYPTGLSQMICRHRCPTPPTARPDLRFQNVLERCGTLSAVNGGARAA